MVIVSVIFLEYLFPNSFNRTNWKIPNMIGAAKVQGFREAIGNHGQPTRHKVGLGSRFNNLKMVEK